MNQPVFSIPIAPETSATWREAEVGTWDSAGVHAWPEPEGQLALDVYLADEAVIVRTAVAGVKPEDLTIAMHNDLLTIRGRREAEDAGRGQYVVQECHWGAFSRSVLLPVPVRAEEVEAVMKQGILTVTLPRIPTITVAVRLEADEAGYV